jgi:hemolysin activation/secretion protein
MLLLAQLNAPSLQPGPVRLPAPVPVEQLDAVPRSRPQPPGFPLDLQPTRPLQPTPVPSAQAAAPAVQGFMPYRRAVLAEILAPCRAVAGLEQRLQSCAAALSARLFSDGYINTRVLPRSGSEPAGLEIQQGRIERIDVISSDPSLQRRIQRLIQPLQGGVLHLPSLTTRLGQLQRLPGVGQLRSSLNRVARDSTRAVLLITVQPEARSLRGEISLRNEGNPGSGQFRSVGTLVEQALLKTADTLFVSAELDADSDPELGSVNTALSYRFPLNDLLGFTAAAGISRRSLVEAEPPIHDLSFRQQQLLGQFDFTLHEGWAQRVYVFAGLSVNRIDAFLAADRAAVIAGGGEDGWLRSGYARFGIGYERSDQSLLLEGSLYGLQSVHALTPEQQRQELAFLGINLSRASAIGSQWSLAWSPAPRWWLHVRTAGQLALHPLPHPMGFSLGSDNGLRGLPGQAISGDSGVLGSAELAWQFWRGERQSLQAVPFFGAGHVWTELPGTSLSDSIGAGGLLLRWTHGRHHVLELGWVKQFQAAMPAFWDRWILGSGVYTKLVYRF